MYLSHYHLNVKPFQITPDPQFLWLGASHKEALSLFKDGIDRNIGLILLTGDVGTGKTTLINKLIESLDKNALVASVQYPGFDILDFYNFLAANFKMGKKYSNKGDFLIQFIHYLHEQHAQNQKVVLVIDEAQGLSDEILDEIRLLSNLERAKVKLLNILLVGQDEMDKILAEPNNKALADGIAAKYFLGPLKKWEVRDYIQFRLKVAGADYRIFNKGAIDEVVKSSQCFPRLINVICDHALLTGYVQGKNKIDAAIVKECAKEHQLQLIDDIEPEAVETESARPTVEALPKSSANYHWALPAILVLVLSLLIFAGYAAYLKTTVETPGIEPNETVIKTTVEKTEDKRKKKMPTSVGQGGVPKTHTTPIENAKPSYGAEITNDGPVNNVQTVEEGDEKGGVAIDNTADAELKPPEESTVEQNSALDPIPNSINADLEKSADIHSQLPKNQQPGADRFKLVLNFPAYAEDLPEDAYAQLDPFVINALHYPDAMILIKGYTDSSGNARQNETLSQVRAESVKRYLMAKGLNQHKIEAVGLGNKDPVASNETVEGRNANRRIEIELVYPSTSNASPHRYSYSDNPL